MIDLCIFCLCHFLCFDERREKVFVNDALKFPAFHDGKARESTRWFFVMNFLIWDDRDEGERCKQTNGQTFIETWIFNVRDQFDVFFNSTQSLTFYPIDRLIYDASVVFSLHIDARDSFFKTTKCLCFCPNHIQNAHMLQIMMSAAKCCKKKQR